VDTAELRHVQIQKDHVVLFGTCGMYSLNAVVDNIATEAKDSEHLSHDKA
jgi:hypothetical protein